MCILSTNLGKFIVQYTSTLKVKYVLYLRLHDKISITSLCMLQSSAMRCRFRLDLNDGHRQDKLNTTLSPISHWLRSVLIIGYPLAVGSNV